MCDHLFMCAYVCLHAHLCARACGGQRRALGLLELELQATVSHLLWVLGIQLDHGAIFPAPAQAPAAGGLDHDIIRWEWPIRQLFPGHDVFIPGQFCFFLCVTKLLVLAHSQARGLSRHLTK